MKAVANAICTVATGTELTRANGIKKFVCMLGRFSVGVSEFTHEIGEGFFFRWTHDCTVFINPE